MTSAKTHSSTEGTEQSQPSPEDRYRSWPDLTFYYGLGWDEIRRMPRWLRRIYIEELPRLKAEQKSSEIDISSFPHMDKQGQKRMLRRISRDLREEAKKPSSTADAQQALAGIGVAVKTVPAKGGGS